jgi:hypothetical protein
LKYSNKGIVDGSVDTENPRNSIAKEYHEKGQYQGKGFKERIPPGDLKTVRVAEDLSNHHAELFHAETF